MQPIPFQLVKATSTFLVDTKRREIWTVYAKPISTEEQESIDSDTHDRQNRVLRLMLDQPDLSLLKMAEVLNWRTVTGEVSKGKVHYVIKSLARRKLVEQDSGSQHWILTNKGEHVARELPEMPF